MSDGKKGSGFNGKREKEDPSPSSNSKTPNKKQPARQRGSDIYESSRLPGFYSKENSEARQKRIAANPWIPDITKSPERRGEREELSKKLLQTMPEYGLANDQPDRAEQTSEEELETRMAKNMEHVKKQYMGLFPPRREDGDDGGSGAAGATA